MDLGVFGVIWVGIWVGKVSGVEQSGGEERIGPSLHCPPLHHETATPAHAPRLDVRARAGRSRSARATENASLKVGPKATGLSAARPLSITKPLRACHLPPPDSG